MNLDGVGWAAAEIVLFMLVATVVGLAIGWIFGRWLQGRTVADEFEAEFAAQEELARKAEHRLTESNKTLDKLQMELQGRNERIGELEAQLESVTEELDAAPDAAAVAALARARGDLEAAGEEREKLASRVAELEDVVAGGEALTSRVSELEAQLADRDAQIADLQTRISNQGPPAPRSEDGPTKEQALAKIAGIADRTAGGVPAVDDDLKQVRGIGPKLERTLKDLGITSFKQIANLEADDIAYVAAALGAFRGRIERDDWMSSAAVLQEEKYGEPV